MKASIPLQSWHVRLPALLAAFALESEFNFHSADAGIAASFRRDGHVPAHRSSRGPYRCI